MGVVYKAMHPGLGVPVAIKVLGDTFSSDESFRSRFRKEASTVASLNHPGIVRVYDFDIDRGALFIVMEFVEGRSLRTWLQDSGRFTAAVSSDLIQQLLSAVGAAHARGIVHRDLKPDNVLISTQGKTKILDFGIAKVMDDEAHLTATGSMVGTPAYMAPEQIKGDPVDQRVDVYALGVILYELLHGKPPYTGSMPTVLHSHVFNQPQPSTAIAPETFEAILRAMARKPEQRFESCEEFAGALLSAPVGTRPGSAPALPPAAPPPVRVGTGLADRVFTGLRALRDPSGSPIAGPAGGCSHSGCTANEGWQCSYIDPTGQRCDSWWCKRHIGFIEATPFCTRHASVLRALAATAGTIHEIKQRPLVDDRSLNLANLVAEDVEKDLTELLRRRFQGRQDLRIVVDRTVRQTWEGRGRIAWERSWSAVQAQGYLARIGVRVAAAEPDRVKVSVGNSVVLSEVPDWIAKRPDGETPDRADRARFRNKVVEIVLATIDIPTPLPRPPAAAPAAVFADQPRVAPALLTGMVLRQLALGSKLTGYEIAERLALSFAGVHPTLTEISGLGFVNVLGFAAEAGPWSSRPLPERMAYAITPQGRAHAEELGATGSHHPGPAPVTLAEYVTSVSAASVPRQLTEAEVAAALAGLEVPPAVIESVRAAINSRGSIFLYGSPGNGKTSLARRLATLQGGPVLVPVAIEAAGDVIRVFDPAVHRLEGEQPPDRRWRRVARPMLQVGGEFNLEMLEATWEPAGRSYEAPLQVKANCGVLLIDDLGRQRTSPKQLLDRLLVPLEQGVDFLNLAGSGRKIEIALQAQVAFSTNLKPADLLDEAYLRRLAYKVLMPDPSWPAFQRIFDRECVRLGVPAAPAGTLDTIQQLYGGRPPRGSHPRDLLERLVDVAAARGERPEVTPQLLEAAWQTLFVTS